ncbi:MULTISPECIES: cbb3-type cytochrome oxidase assembly protein CcoS [Shinella]|jgi:cbb3-type cytochrome oxidase maturation protein|uniref:Cbb3-type cytochrome oxidase assembly protein CcoS n=2 Tax=Shinella TaxID=323620 RepID=A0A6N8SJ33_9HYPH|nr:MULTISPECIES: cbb3-type cytochrome oxidase assembly protein CcoS [Shinella]MCQ4634594.1 cbb3-type cytochrome oxidase assembly protein CcoS [Shinella lacus]MCT7664004.1 cbb3-type cytochrome oxidase assembly protein CcoS [Shinella kummerowiae]MXN48497.1 cbb3-type cytochrome oxidase assembly protein CcoS [Shinella kummerowiae]
MTAISVLVPLSIVMGIAGLLAFLWSLRTRQYEDLDGAAARILLDSDEDDAIDRDRRRHMSRNGG